MRKLIIAVLGVVLISVLTSCVRTVRIANMEPQRISRLSLMQHIVDSIKNRDSVSLKSVFSQKVINEVPDLDERIAYILANFSDDVLSIEVFNDDNPQENGKIQNGKRSVQQNSLYKLNTKNGVYKVFISNFPFDTIDPSNCGLYTLRIFRIEDNEKYFASMLDMIQPGIFVPDGALEK